MNLLSLCLHLHNSIFVVYYLENIKRKKRALLRRKSILMTVY